MPFHTHLSILVPAKIRSKIFEDEDTNQPQPLMEEFLVNSTITLHCPVDGSPTPKINWKKASYVNHSIGKKISLACIHYINLAYRWYL